MSKFICATCGTQFPESSGYPDSCPICQDERQYVGWNGQEWTTLGDMRVKGYKNVLGEEGDKLYSIVTEPSFAIGQRAFLIKTQNGIVMWDCLPYIDEVTIDQVRKLGELEMIAISHPHYYSSMVEWSESFGGVPVYLHKSDRAHVVYQSDRIRYWEGESIIPLKGISLVNLGGHFDGGTVLHWEDGANGRGIVLSGDIIQVVQDRRWASFMYSYPNLIPLSESKIRQIGERISKYRFEKLYGAFKGRQILSDARNAVRRSAERYIAHIK